MPALPAAALVVAQAQVLLAFLEAALDGPTTTGQLGQGCPAEAGCWAATCRTSRARGAPGTSRVRVGGRPWAGAGGTWVAGASVQTRVLWGTSAQ